MPILFRLNTAWLSTSLKPACLTKAVWAFLLLLIPAVSMAQTPPGTPFPNTSELSDQKPGSILFYNYYTSNPDAPQTQNTEFSLTNTHSSTAVSLHMFFINGTNGSVLDILFSLAPRQTISFLASSLDPGVTGYAVVVAVNSATGCPINFNHLIGNAFIKLSSGQQASLPAVAVAAIASIPSVCDNSVISATLNFDGVNYNKLPRMEVMNGIAAPADGNNTLFILNRIGGDLSVGAATLGFMFGVLYDDSESLFSFTFAGNSQFVSPLDVSFPRTSPRITNIITAGRSGWMKVYKFDSDDAILGASLNFNSNSGSNAKKYDNGQNFTHRALTEGPTTLMVPVFPVNCSYNIAPLNASFAASGGTGSVTVTSNGCLWTGVSNVPWISVISTSVIFQGGTLDYQVAGNPSASPRTGTITIAGNTFTVNQFGNCASITVAPASLPSSTVGVAYNQTLTASGGAAPYVFTVAAGILPTGLGLSASGTLSGTPTQAGVFNFTVQAADTANCVGSMTYAVTINPGVVNTSLQFFPLPTPVRLLDTRPDASPNACSQPNAPITGQTSRTQPGRLICGIPANAAALTGNVTTVNSGGGFLTLYPSDAQQPTVASTNYGPNEIINNVFTVGLGADGAFKIFANTTTDVVVDVTGYYAAPSTNGLYFHPLPKPVRLLETRAGQTVGCVKPGVPLTGNAESTHQPISACTNIPAAARAIVGNATTVGPQGGGFLTIFPADSTRPLVASSNFNTGQIVNAPFTVGLAANGEFKIFTTSTTDLVIDVLGYYSAEANDLFGIGLLFTPLAHPIRLLETRAGQSVGCFKPGAPLAGGSETTQTAHGLCDGLTIPATAQSVVGNATVVFPSGPGFLTLWQSGELRPLTATSNYNSGDVGNRHFIVRLSQSGLFKIYTHATTDLVIDLSGYFAP
jgi:hypothetical protein